MKKKRKGNPIARMFAEMLFDHARDSLVPKRKPRLKKLKSQLTKKRRLK